MKIKGVSETSERVLRGGSWLNDADNLRASYRNRNHAWNRNDNIGFRVCLCGRSSSEHAFHTEYGKPCRKCPGQPGDPGRPNRHGPTVPVSFPRETHRPVGPTQVAWTGSPRPCPSPILHNPTRIAALNIPLFPYLDSVYCSTLSRATSPPYLITDCQSALVITG